MSSTHLKSSIRLRPSASDNGALFTCAAQHPALASVTSASFASERPSASKSRRTLYTQLRLNVLFPPEAPKIGGFTGSQPLKAGYTVNLVCTSAGGNPHPQLVWYRNGVQVDFSWSNNGRESTNTHSFLVTPNDHNALYRCVASPVSKTEPAVRLSESK